MGKAEFKKARTRRSHACITFSFFFLSCWWPIRQGRTKKMKWDEKEESFPSLLVTHVGENSKWMCSKNWGENREVLRAGLMKYECYTIGSYKIYQIQTDIAVWECVADPEHLLGVRKHHYQTPLWNFFIDTWTMEYMTWTWILIATHNWLMLFCCCFLLCFPFCFQYYGTTAPEYLCYDIYIYILYYCTCAFVCES